MKRTFFTVLGTMAIGGAAALAVLDSSTLNMQVRDLGAEPVVVTVLDGTEANAPMVVTPVASGDAIVPGDQN